MEKEKDSRFGRGMRIGDFCLYFIRAPVRGFNNLVIDEPGGMEMLTEEIDDELADSFVIGRCREFKA